MEVKIFPHTGRTRTGAEVTIGNKYGPQYRVYVDGIGVGYVGSHPGAKVLLTERRFSAMELEEIRSKVANLRGVDVNEIKQPPQVDPELLKAKDDGATEDDFN